MYRFKIVSRLLAGAFNLEETHEEHFAIECEDCPRGPHDVLNAMDSKEEMKEWFLLHQVKTGHMQFSEYKITRLRVVSRKLHMKD